MKRKRLFTILGVGLGVLVAVSAYSRLRSHTLVLTGIVTTNDVIVSSQISGQVEQLLVSEGDSVTPNQLLAVLSPGELAADTAFYQRTAQAMASQVRAGEADLRHQEAETSQGIRAAGATLAASQAQEDESRANLANARLVLDRSEELFKAGGLTNQDIDQARTTYAVARARADAAGKQVEAEQAALALARAGQNQVAVTRSSLAATQQQQAAADAQTRKAGVRLAYSEIRAPLAGVVDTRAIRLGEVVAPDQAILTLINPDDLWIRVDVEESYIDRVRLGDSLVVRLPSGMERRGRVFFRGVDADFATQRDVSRTKRDIKTFELRLRVDNHDRHLATGMTAYVLLPIPRSGS